MPVTISNLKMFHVQLPFKKPIYMNDRCIKLADNLIIKLELSNGIIGWGEAPAATRMTGEIPSTMKSAIEQIFLPLVIGKDIENYLQIINQVNKSMFANTGAKNSISIAILDCYSQFKNMSFGELLGDKKREQFSSICILGNKSWEENIDEAISLKEQGFNSFKIKVASKDIKEDITGTLNLRERLGSSVIISADANSGLTLESSIDYIKSVIPANLQFFEQPLPDMLDLSKLQRETNVGICGDESISCDQDIKTLSFCNAVKGVNLKLIKLSDPLSLVNASMLCRDLNLNINISGKVSESGILTAALLHCASVVPNINWGISTTNQYLVTDIATGIPIEGSVISLPSGVGLGISVDEYLLKQFLV